MEGGGVVADRNFVFCLEKADVAMPVSEEAVHESFAALWGEAGKKKQRHREQESSLIAHLDLGKISEVVEYGCGTASLSAHLARVAAREEDRKTLWRFHLLDVATFRSNVRQDKIIRSLGGEAHRITVDVFKFDFDLHFSSILNPFCSNSQIALISKHFCGSAMCKLLENYSANTFSPKIMQLAVAPCCHGKIQRNLFFGDLKWIESDLGLNFEMLKKVSGWATLNNLEEGKKDDDLGIGRREKKEMGLKAKVIFDVARLRNIREKNLRFVKYTSASIECNLICTPN